MFALRLYRKPLRFEVEEKGSHFGFVDKEAVLGWDDITVTRKDPNKEYVIGLHPAPAKIRYPQFLGPPFVRRRKLKSWMMSTWFAETTADDPEKQRLGALRVIAELQCQRFPNAPLKQLAASVQAQRLRRLRSTAQRYLSIILHLNVILN